MKIFSRRQIRNFERARSELISKIEIFEAGMEFAKQDDIVRSITEIQEFNADWIEELKKAINNVNIRKNMFGGRKIRSKKRKIAIIAKYVVDMFHIIYKEFGRTVIDDPINKIEEFLREYEKKLKKLF